MARLKHTDSRLRKGCMKKNWKKVRTLIVQMPGSSSEQAAEQQGESEEDDGGADYLREMAKTDALHDATADACARAQGGSKTAGIAVQVEAGEPGFAIDLIKTHRQALRVYMQKGKHGDMAFERLCHNWAKYGAKKRLSKMKHLKLPKEIFQCCPEGSSRGVCGRACQCQQSARRAFFAQVAGRKSQRSALDFLSEQRNKVYRSRRGA